MERKNEKFDFSAKPHELSSIKKVIGIVSGKGGVGKSLVTSMLAVMMNKKGYHTAILDADVTGPSIPRIFGITAKATANELGIIPVKSETGIDIMSINLLYACHCTDQPSRIALSQLGNLGEVNVGLTLEFP